MEERRQSQRIPWLTEVECEELDSGTLHAGALLSDISLTGVFVEGLPTLPEGAALRLRFTLPSLQMSLTATVVRSKPGGLGLVFRDVTPVQRVVIQELMNPEAFTPAPTPAPRSGPDQATGVVAGAPTGPEEVEEVDEPWPPPLPDLPAPAAASPAPSPVSATAGPAGGAEPGGFAAAEAPEPTAAPGDSGEEAAREDAPGGPRRVLVVDDHDRTRTMLRGMIEGRTKEYVVTEARDGEECLELAGRQPPFDLIFLDIDMPRLDGLSTCRRLRAAGVKSPIIFLTGRSELDDFRAGREAGADTYIKKPIVLGTLRSMLGLFTSGSIQRR